MPADSTRESGTRGKLPDNQPNWQAKEPGLLERQTQKTQPDNLVAVLLVNEQQPADAQAPPSNRRGSPEDFRAQLKVFEAEVAQGKQVDKQRYATLLSSVATFEWRESEQLVGQQRQDKLAESNSHFKRAYKELKDVVGSGETLDADSARNYTEMLRLYGRVSMLHLHSYEGVDQRSYTKDPAKLAEAIQDRQEADEAFTTAAKLGKKHQMPPKLLADLLRDKGLNATLLADDQFRPEGPGGTPSDPEKWREKKLAGIADLNAAATLDRENGQLTEARDHFRLAVREYKDFFTQTDKDFAERRKNGLPIDPSAEKSYQAAEKDYVELARGYGRTVMLLWSSYDNAAVPGYVDNRNPRLLEQVVQDRKDINEALGTAVKLAEKNPIAPINFVDLLRDQGLNAALLADDQYRPYRLGQNPTDLLGWRTLKDGAIAVLERANSRLDGKDILGAKDPNQNLDLDKPREEKSATAKMMRAKILYELALVETHRAYETKDANKFAATSTVADSAGKHFVQAMNAWDQYEKPEARGDLLFRSKLVHDNLQQLYNDYIPFIHLVANNHPDPQMKAFMAGELFRTHTKLANIRRLETNVDR